LWARLGATAAVTLALGAGCWAVLHAAGVDPATAESPAAAGLAAGCGDAGHGVGKPGRRLRSGAVSGAPMVARSPGALATSDVQGAVFGPGGDFAGASIYIATGASSQAVPAGRRSLLPVAWARAGVRRGAGGAGGCRRWRARAGSPGGRRAEPSPTRCRSMLVATSAVSSGAGWRIRDGGSTLPDARSSAAEGLGGSGVSCVVGFGGVGAGPLPDSGPGQAERALSGGDGVPQRTAGLFFDLV